MNRSANPLTPLGLSVFGIGLFGFLFGWLFGWIELIVLATACTLALLLAIPFVVGRVQLVTERRLVRSRVTVGERAHVTFEFTNPRSTPTRARGLRDVLRARSSDWRGERSIEIPSLAGGASETVTYELPGLDRGCFEVGPAVISRTDPLRLMRRDIVHSGVDVLWVHPRYEAVGALPVGFAKDLEGPTSDTSPAGDVAFHSLREYATGDDYRHIHWMSTARVGRPMVRHYVDNRRPHLAVLLDVEPEAFSADQFETAVEVVASLSVSALLRGEPLTVWAGRSVVAGAGQLVDRDSVLDKLSLVHRADNTPLTAAAADIVRSERGISAVAVVTGGRPSLNVLEVVEQIRRKARPIVVRVWPSGRPQTEPLPHAMTIDIDSLDAFAANWQEAVR